MNKQRYFTGYLTYPVFIHSFTCRLQDIVLVDVHSGLGPSGVDTLAYMTFDKQLFQASLTKIEKHFPTENDKSGGIKEAAMGSTNRDGALSGYDLTTGTITESFCKSTLAPALSDEHKLCFTQEFGTKSNVIVGMNQLTHSLTHSPTYWLTHLLLTQMQLTAALILLLMNVGKSMIDENYAHHYGTAEEKEVYGNRVKNSFYVRHQRIYSLTHWLTHSLTHSFTYILT